MTSRDRSAQRQDNEDWLGPKDESAISSNLNREDPMTNSISEAICRNSGEPASKCREHNLHCGYPSCLIRASVDTGVEACERMAKIMGCEFVKRDTPITPPLDSEAVERVIAEIDYQESAPEPKGRFATVRIDDLRALLSLAKPVGGGE